MRYQQAVETYLTDLGQKEYSKGEIQRKAGLLRKWLSYALSLFQPGMPKELSKLDQPVFYFRGKIFTEVTEEKRKAVEHFLEVLRSEPITYMSVAVFMKNYRRHYLETEVEKEQKEEALASFLRAVGCTIDIRKISKKTYQQCLDYLASIRVQRVQGYSKAFFHFCHDQGWISFNPYEERRSPYQKLFEADFISETGIWGNRLKSYLHYLKFERNLSEGGIDHQVRKLKIFAGWLDSEGVKKVKVDILKTFTDKKRREGVAEATVGKYLYSIKYFFQFLVHRGDILENPAGKLKITGHTYSEGEILTEIEVNQVLEHLEKEISQTTGAHDIQRMTQYFRAVRDVSMFHFFTYTGMRLSEVIGIEMKDIDFEKQSVRFKAKGNRQYRKKYRELLLDDSLWAVLERYLKVRGHPGQRYVWLSFTGSGLSLSRVIGVIKSRVKQAGIDKKISPHRLRATCASLYVRKGMDPFTLKTLMGHQSIATTMDKYAQLTEEELREIWKKTNPLAGMDDDE